MASKQSAESRAPVGADLVIPALALGFAIYYLFSVGSLGWEAKANGVLIGALLVVLIGFQLARVAVALARGRASLAMDPLLRPRDALVRRAGVVAIAVAFVGSMQWLGLTLSLLLAMAAMLRLLGVRARAQLFWIPVVAAALTYALFILVLKAEFPHGPLEHLLAPLFHGSAT